MLRNITVEAGPSDAGQRLDVFLFGRCPTSTRAFCRHAAEGGRILVNGLRRQKGHKLRAGDVVTITALKEASDNCVRADASVPLDIVYEDDWLIGANKPAGMAVHPLVSEELGTLANGLVARYPELAGVGDQPLMAGALHRIDTGTSGLVLAARTNAAFEAMRAQFAAQSIEKVYYALVEGHVAVPGVLTHELAHHPALPHCKMVDARSLDAPHRRMRAVTAYRPLELKGPYTLLEVTIRTGVTHQIRCQLALGGWPIVNDTLYGARPVGGRTRHWLHAFEARFSHPASGEACCLRAPVPADFLALQNDMKGECS